MNQSPCADSRPRRKKNSIFKLAGATPREQCKGVFSSGRLARVTWAHESSRFQQGLALRSRLDTKVNNSSFNAAHLGISDHSLIYSLRKLYVLKSRPISLESEQFKSLILRLLEKTHEDIIMHDDPNKPGISGRNCFWRCQTHDLGRRRKNSKGYAPWLTSDLKRLIFN